VCRQPSASTEHTQCMHSRPLTLIWLSPAWQIQSSVIINWQAKNLGSVTQLPRKKRQSSLHVQLRPNASNCIRGCCGQTYKALATSTVRFPRIRPCTPFLRMFSACKNILVMHSVRITHMLMLSTALLCRRCGAVSYVKCLCLMLEPRRRSLSRDTVRRNNRTDLHIQ
jgi:hypothetical protein